jgi:hypothetical protein
MIDVAIMIGGTRPGRKGEAVASWSRPEVLTAE